MTWSQGGGRCCDLCLGGGRCCDLALGGEGGVVTWSRGGGRRCWDLVPGGEGGSCCDLVPGGGVVTWFQGGKVLWPGSRGGEGVVTWSQGQGEGGREVLWPGPGGEGGVVHRPLVFHSPPPCWTEWVTHAYKNITFARFATRAVITSLCLFTRGPPCDRHPWCYWSVTNHIGPYPGPRLSPPTQMRIPTQSLYIFRNSSNLSRFEQNIETWSLFREVQWRSHWCQWPLACYLSHRCVALKEQWVI